MLIPMDKCSAVIVITDKSEVSFKKATLVYEYSMLNRHRCNIYMRSSEISDFDDLSTLAKVIKGEGSQKERKKKERKKEKKENLFTHST